MATAGQYKPMKSKIAKNKIPVEIIRCVDKDGNYVLLKKYEAYHSRKLIPYRLEQEPCKLDMPAEFKVSYKPESYAVKNENYQYEMIKYCIEKQNVNEYELRNLVVTYLERKRKEMDKDKFREICDIFDKADKMLAKSDRRKNSNRHEANISYKFLIKSYGKIVDLCEVKKKVDKPLDLVVQLMEKAIIEIRKGAIFYENKTTSQIIIHCIDNETQLVLDALLFKAYIDKFHKEEGFLDE